MASFIINLLIPLAVGGLSGFLSKGSMGIYEGLIKPPLSPPPWAFPVAWVILYLLMGIAAYLVWRPDKPASQKKGALAVYALQLAVNFFWPILFFNFQAYFAAFLWLVLLILLVIITIGRFAAIDKRAAGALIPYLLWISFAGYLNLSIYLLNR